MTVRQECCNDASSGVVSAAIPPVGMILAHHVGHDVQDGFKLWSTTLEREFPERLPTLKVSQVLENLTLSKD